MSKKRKIYESAVETFEITCFLFPVEKQDGESDGPNNDRGSHLRSIVGFNGATDGKVVITPSVSLLSAMAANMLGIDSPDQSQKEEALCEVANIISGNIAPLFSHDEEICYINPPRLIERKGEQEYAMEGAEKESIRIFFNEGVADIKVYHQIQEAS